MNEIEVFQSKVDVAVHGRLGNEILSLLGRVIPIAGSCFYEVDNNLVATHHYMQNLEEKWLGAYRDCFFEYDPLHPSRYAEDCTTIARLHMNAEGCDRRAKEYLANFLIPQDTPYQLEIYFRSAGRIVAGASLVRRREMGGFTDEEVNLLERIVPFMEFSVRWISDNLPEDRLETFGLSPRECEIAGLVVHGLSNKEICRHLGLELPTVKTYMSRIFAKTGVRTRTALLNQLFLEH